MSSLHRSDLLPAGGATVGHRHAARAGDDDGEVVEAHVAHTPRPVSLHAPRQGCLTANIYVMMSASYNASHRIRITQKGRQRSSLLFAPRT